jgi:putative transposase
VRSDNGLILTARRFSAACRDYRLRQEFIAPYTPEQNGMIERFFCSLEEEGVWQHNFASFAEARSAIAGWIRWYNERRTHEALDSPSGRSGCPIAAAVSVGSPAC